MKRLEILLQRCKETIKSNKERVTQLTADKDSLQMSLEWKEQEISKAKVAQPSDCRFTIVVALNRLCYFCVRLGGGMIKRCKAVWRLYDGCMTGCMAVV